MRGILLIAVVVGSAPIAHAGDVQRLTLKQAEERAMEHHPQIRARHYTALAAGEVVRETKSAFFPTVMRRTAHALPPAV